MTLEEFFVEVVKLTVNHRVYAIRPDADFAWVSPADLSKLLEQVDPAWILRLPKKKELAEGAGIEPALRKPEAPG